LRLRLKAILLILVLICTGCLQVKIEVFKGEHYPSDGWGQPFC